jgi:Gram-negative bacterial TonB protein C-terminal
MSNLAFKSPISNQISLSTMMGIIASVGFHGALFAFPNLPLFSVNNKEIKTTPVPIVKLNASEIARLPDLSPQPMQIPEFPNTPLPTTPILTTAVQLPFTAIPTPPSPLPTTSLFLPPDISDQTNIKPESQEIPPIQELPVAKNLPVPPPPLENTEPSAPPLNNTPPLVDKDDLEEQKRKLADQQNLETEFKVNLDSIPIRNTNDILREFSPPPPQLTKNPDVSPAPTSTPPEREFPLLPPTGKQQINPPSEQEIARNDSQQRAAALEKNTANTSDQEANKNYLRWLMTINNVQPENLTIKGKYPKDACLQKLEGNTTYGVLVNTKGEPTQLNLIKSSGYPLFNQNAQIDISFHNFPKDTPKPYLVKVEYSYSTNLCPEQLGDQKQTNSTNNIPPSEQPAEEKKPALPPTNTSISEEKKPALPPTNTSISEEKKSDLIPSNTAISEEKKPALPPTNTSISEEKKPALPPTNTSISEEKKPALPPSNTSISEEKKPALPPTNTSISEEKKPALIPNN